MENVLLFSPSLFPEKDIVGDAHKHKKDGGIPEDDRGSKLYVLTVNLVNVA